MGWNSIKIVNKNFEINQQKMTIILFIVTILIAQIVMITAETKYAINFPSIVNKENVYGCQFHPEKVDQGLNIIRDFINL